MHVMLWLSSFFKTQRITGSPGKWSCLDDRWYGRPEGCRSGLQQLRTLQNELLQEDEIDLLPEHLKSGGEESAQRGAEAAKGPYRHRCHGGTGAPKDLPSLRGKERTAQGGRGSRRGMRWREGSSLMLGHLWEQRQHFSCNTLPFVSRVMRCHGTGRRFFMRKP